MGELITGGFLVTELSQLVYLYKNVVGGEPENFNYLGIEKF